MFWCARGLLLKANAVFEVLWRAFGGFWRAWGLILTLAVPFDLLLAGKNSWWIFASDLEILLDFLACRSIKRAWAGICWLLARVGAFPYFGAVLASFCGLL